MSNEQHRKYLLTINNPKDYGLGHAEIKAILSLFSLVYYCIVDEIGEQGTHHTHVFVVFASPVRFSTIQRRFGVAHIDPAYGSASQNRDYLRKDGKWEDTKKSETTVEGSFEEYGEMPTEQEEKHGLMYRVRQMLEDGASTTEIICEFPNLGFRVNQIDTLRQAILEDKYSTDNRDVEVVYIHGETGTGKTSGIYSAHDPRDVCRITNYKGDRIYFDSYRGQSVIVFEEFHSQIPMPDMLSYLDVYPLMLPARYHDRVACYSAVYITSNIPITQQYTEVQRNEPATWDAFIRRIRKIRRYDGTGKYEDFLVESGGFLLC